MVDKVYPSKVESIAGGGGQDDLDQTATDPDRNYLAAKGIAFEAMDNTRIEKAADGSIQIVTAVDGTLKIKSPIPLIIALG
jgi:hypothetical protein